MSVVLPFSMLLEYIYIHLDLVLSFKTEPGKFWPGASIIPSFILF